MRTKVGILRKTVKALREWSKGKNTIYWDHDLFPGIIMRFPDDLLTRTKYMDPTRVKDTLKAYVVQTICHPKAKTKPETVDQIFAYGNLDAIQVKSKPEWQQMLYDLADHTEEVVVRPNEAVILYHKGSILGVAFEPGVYTIDRDNRVPGLEFAYVQTNEIREYRNPKGEVISQEGILWGLPYMEGPLVKAAEDPEYSKVKIKIGANGNYLLQVEDVEKLFTQLIGSAKIQSSNDLAMMISGEIKEGFMRQMASRTYETVYGNSQFLGEAIKNDPILVNRLRDYGLRVNKVSIKTISIDPSKKEFIDRIVNAGDLEAKILNKSSSTVEMSSLDAELEKERKLAELRKLRATTSEERFEKEFEHTLKKDMVQTEGSVSAQVEAAKAEGQIARETLNSTKELLGAMQGVNVGGAGTPRQSSAPSAEPEGENKFCMYCGQNLPIEAGFCFKCGKQQPQI